MLLSLEPRSCIAVCHWLASLSLMVWWAMMSA